MATSDSDDSSSTSVSLLQRVCSQDEEAWTRLCKLYGPLIYSQCRAAGMQNSDSHDVSQEVFEAVRRKIGDFQKTEEKYTFRGWLGTITKHKVIDFYRVQARGRCAEGGSENLRRIEQLEAEPPSDASVITSGVDPLYRRALELVQSDYDERTWAIFLRFTRDGCSAQEVAQEFGTTAGNVRQINFRIRKKLQAEYEGLLEFSGDVGRLPDPDSEANV